MTQLPKQKNSGIPLIGIGTWKLRGEECIKTIHAALQLGYRHIDTADAYENHAAIGTAIQTWPRNELFLTTKISLTSLKPEQVKTAVPRFLKELKTDYIDLLLIHWPDPQISLTDTLKAMMEFKNLGVVRSIGVSNFVRSHLEILSRFPILTNQIEMHPYLQRKTLVAAYKSKGIGITAYRPLAKGAFETDSVLKKIGARYGKSASQIALRWLVQQEIAAIPKASTQKHSEENLEIFNFVLSMEEMKQIESLDRGKRFCSPEGFPMMED